MHSQLFLSGLVARTSLMVLSACDSAPKGCAPGWTVVGGVCVRETTPRDSSTPPDTGSGDSTVAGDSAVAGDECAAGQLCVPTEFAAEDAYCVDRDPSAAEDPRCAPRCVTADDSVLGIGCNATLGACQS